MMKKAKAIIALLLTMCCGGVADAQETVEERITLLDQKMQQYTDKQKFAPQLHGILRGKYEYQPDLDASRFEVRNARLSAEGNLPLHSSYKLEVDLCDESSIKMKDAWVRLQPVSTLRVTIGQQRMPFSIDAHRNPSAQYFANRSFIAKQVGDMRDVGAAVGYDIISREHRKVLSIDAGVYNGSNLDNQKTAWFSAPAYSARLQYFPIKSLALVPSVQHQLIAKREASYTTLDFGAYYETSVLHLEAEYARKFYARHAFSDCNAANIMAIWTLPVPSLRREDSHSFIQGIKALLRYDYMDRHSDGKQGFEEPTLPPSDGRNRILVQTDAQRHRLTAGLTFTVRNPYFPTDIRLNYEKYWYPHAGTPKESEQDKLVAELMIKF